MANLREIKNSIESVKKTRKLTQAMKMVAAAKFKRSTDKFMQSKPYLDGLENIMTGLSERLEPDFLPALMQTNNAKKKIFIVIGADRGLCGGFNNNLFKFVNQEIEKESSPVELVLFGNKSIQFFKNKSTPVVSKHPFFSKTLIKKNVTQAMDEIVKQFERKEVSEIRLFVNEFKSALAVEPSARTLAPLSFSKTDDKKQTLESNYFYEPNETTIVNEIIEEYVGYLVYSAFIESVAGEEGARMTAMDAATDNARDMINSLTLVYNRTRQAKITSELTEIVAGANALT